MKYFFKRRHFESTIGGGLPGFLIAHFSSNETLIRWLDLLGIATVVILHIKFWIRLGSD